MSSVTALAARSPCIAGPTAFRLRLAHRQRASPRRRVRLAAGAQQQAAIEELASRDEVLKFLSSGHKDVREKHKLVEEIMQTNLVVTHPEAPLAEVESKLVGIEGLPVVDDQGKLVGVVSRKDFKKAGSHVKDVMSSSVIALKAGDRVSDAAHSMIDHKIHRVPIVDDAGACVGIVTRTDIFWALASESDRTAFFQEHGIDL